MKRQKKTLGFDKMPGLKNVLTGLEHSFENKECFEEEMVQVLIQIKEQLQLIHADLKLLIDRGLPR